MCARSEDANKKVEVQNKDKRQTNEGTPQLVYRTARKQVSHSLEIVIYILLFLKYLSQNLNLKASRRIPHGAGLAEGSQCSQLSANEIIHNN